MIKRHLPWILAAIAAPGCLFLGYLGLILMFNLPGAQYADERLAKAFAIFDFVVPGFLLAMAAVILTVVRLANSARNRIGWLLAVLSCCLFAAGLIVWIVIPEPY